MQIPIETVRTHTFEMNYFRLGKGKRTMVILPGLSVQSVMGLGEAVAAEYEVMANDFTVYVFDRRLSLPPAYSVYDMAEDTAEAIQMLGLRDIHLFGTSQGGMIAMEIACRYPAIISKLALGSTTSHVKDGQYRQMKQWIDLAKKKDSVGLYLAFGEKLYPPTLFAQYKDMLAAAGETVTEEELARFVVLAKGTKGFDVSDRLHGIQCPVLVIGSWDDEVVGGDATLEIVKQIGDRPDVESYMYTGYGHAAYDTAPDYRRRLYRFFMK